VGKVVCLIENPDLDLLPGTNVNAAIQSQVVPDDVAIPKEALRTVANQPGVFLLDGDHVAWRKVTIGVSTVIKAQVTSGLSAGDSVALATDFPLKDGSRVKPYYPVI
jgi:cobalt-zinc-cadmium efflux system membrane fusion protein